MLEHLQRTSETWLLKWSKVNYHFQIELKINCGLSLHVIKNLGNLQNEMLTWDINYFVDELQKLVDIGYGKLVRKEEMKRDKILPSNQCSNVYMKPEMTFLDPNFFAMVMDSELKDMTYAANFHKDMDDNSKIRLHPHVSITINNWIGNM